LAWSLVAAVIVLVQVPSTWKTSVAVHDLPAAILTFFAPVPPAPMS
jgi:hypothetical protein